jgi:endonuclease YncB( thermonuclease family)
LAIAGSCARADEPCGWTPTLPVVVRSVDARLEPRLADGRIIQLPDLDIPEGARDHAHFASQARAALAWLVGQEATAVPIEQRLDRWGRTVARLYAKAPGSTPNAAPLWVEKVLVGAGWARVMPSQDVGPCLSDLLSAEAQARGSGLGLWADPYYSVLPARNQADFAKHADEAVIVKGKIASLGSAGSRFYLNFGPDRRRDLAISVSKQTAKRFAAAGRPLAGYVGSILRVRGLLDFWFGPKIEVDSLNQIEILAAAPAKR